ncbi:MAG: hypothetical protein ACT4NY_15340 [Pseudonocardiales bacterium]
MLSSPGWRAPRTGTIIARTARLYLELGQLCGWCAYDDGQQGLAQRYYVSFVRDRQLFTINLAETLAGPGRQRDLDAAATRGMEALRLTEGLDSTRTVDLLRDLSHQLSPHAKVPAVRDFMEQAREFVQA